MENTLTFVMTVSERDMIRRALEALADEYRHIGEAVASRYLAEDFKADASEVR